MAQVGLISWASENVLTHLAPQAPGRVQVGGRQWSAAFSDALLVGMCMVQRVVHAGMLLL